MVGNLSVSILNLVWSPILGQVPPESWGNLSVKIKNEQVKRNFHFRELVCPCGCGSAWISMESLDNLQMLRDLIKEPIILNSACRCVQHNKDVSGVPESRHISTENHDSDAYDVRCETALLRAKLLHYAKEAGFTYVRVYRTWIHLDCRPCSYTIKIVT